MRVRGDAIFPPSLAGRLHILFTILRQLALVASVALLSNELKTLDPDVIFVDQLSVCVPFFRLLYPKAKVLFYGHFPDRLLAKEPEGVLGKVVKRLYRIPFDEIEGWSTGCSDGIVVNSKFTRAVFRGTFHGLRQRDLKVIYPCVDTGDASKEQEAAQPLWPDKKVLLSINRFEGKKNLDLALRAYAGLSASERSKAKLVIAGGYDPRSPENAATHHSLQSSAEELKLTHATFRPSDTLVTDLESDDVDVLFLLSIPNDLKTRLLRSASLLVYTPTNEHFGIVPLEAMLASVPVLATNTGGPLETIYDGRTGWLRSPTKIEAWTNVMRKPLIRSSAHILTTMGQQGRDRVLAEFSHTKMTESLDAEIQSLCQSKEKRPSIMPDWLLALFYLIAISVPAGLVIVPVFWWAVGMENERAVREAAEKAMENATETVAHVGGSVTSTMSSVVESATSMVREEL